MQLIFQISFSCFNRFVFLIKPGFLPVFMLVRLINASDLSIRSILIVFLFLDFRFNLSHELLLADNLMVQPVFGQQRQFLLNFASQVLKF